jgi:HPt (histidine-containing phosphotransfer) domain-containing protein
MPQTTIDLDTFNELKDAAGAEFVDDLIGTFFEEAPAILAELRGANVARDADGFRRAAHSMKANSLTFGALVLGAAARKLELDGLSADPAADGQAIDALAAAYADAAAALEGLRHG